MILAEFAKKAQKRAEEKERAARYAENRIRYAQERAARVAAETRITEALSKLNTLAPCVVVADCEVLDKSDPGPRVYTEDPVPFPSRLTCGHLSSLRTMMLLSVVMGVQPGVEFEIRPR